MTSRYFLRCCAALALAIPAFASASIPPAPAPSHRANADITGTVTDSANAQPLQSAEVSIASASGGVIANTITDEFGHFTIHNVAAGSYTVTVHMIGYRPATRTLAIAAAATEAQTLDFGLTAVGLSLEAMQVTATVPVAVDTRTGDQVFKQNDYHGAPTSTTSQILQQSIVGAARAPTGEVHIRGQHAEYTYYIDGVPVPPGISGSLNELFDPEVVNQINFQTGGWDAEYGGRNAAIVNVTTKIPAGGFHGTLSGYDGDFAGGSTTSGPTGFHGESVSASDNAGPWGIFVSGASQFSDMRLEPVVFDTATNRILNFHNNGTDGFGFAKIQYTGGAHDVFDLEVNVSQTKFAVPYDSTGEVFANDHQTDDNSFVNLAWHHQFGVPNAEGQTPADLFGGLFYRHASLVYTPDPNDEPSFFFFPDTNAYNLAENRAADIYGIKADYALRPAHELEFKFGTLSSITRGHEDFSAFAPGIQGPQSVSALDGSDFGVYGQTAYSPVEWFELRTGLRYDAHAAPNAPAATQLSPRIRLNFYPSTSTTVYVYYGRLFMPTNIEDLRPITSVAQGDTATQPTSPERDNFYEAGIIQRFPDAGLVAKFSAYNKQSNPGIDDNTIPGSAIVTDVNIEHVRITGLEGVLEYQPSSGPLSGYVNAALNHAYGYGAVTGGFFPTVPPSGYFDLDHDQRLSIVGSATYSPARFYVSGTAIYGSGLTNGVDPSDCGCGTFGTGLFDFNSQFHVNPSTIFNFATGYTFILGQDILQPELYVDNAFNKKYLLKGAFFSGASVGRPRSIQLRVKVAM